MATHWTLGCDAADPHRLAAFWAAALGYVPEPGYDDPDGASLIDPDGRGPAISFLRVPEGKTAKNRMHIDIRVAGKPPWVMGERARLIRARADITFLLVLFVSSLVAALHKHRDHCAKLH